MSDAGIEGAVVVEKVAGGNDSFGFNAATEKYEDLVIDPAKVTRTALQTRSLASRCLMLTTEAMIADVFYRLIPNPQSEIPNRNLAGGMGGVGMGM